MILPPPSSMEMGISLVLAHGLGDLAATKGRDVGRQRSWRELAVHGALITGLSFGFMGRGGLWLPALLVGIIHVMIDVLSEKRAPTPGLFLRDQLFHLIAIAVIADCLGDGWGRRLGS